MAERRLRKDHKGILDKKMKYLLELDASDLFIWKVLIAPNFAPYNEGAFRIEINFPDNYPFRKPSMKFLTKIYHPNVNENGNVDMVMICPSTYGGWSPSITVVQLIEALMNLLKEPNHDHMLRHELFREYRDDRETFFKSAQEYTRKFAEKLPSDQQFCEGKCPRIEEESSMSLKDKEKMKNIAKLSDKELYELEGTPVITTVDPGLSVKTPVLPPRALIAKNKRKRKTDAILQSIENTDNVLKKLCMEDDEDEQFAQVIKFHLKRVPVEKKLDIQMKLLAVIKDEINKQ